MSKIQVINPKIFFLLTSGLYVFLMIFGLICLSFGLIGLSTLELFIQSYSSANPLVHIYEIVAAIFLLLISIYYVILFLVNIIRWIKLLKSKELGDKLYHLKRMQRSILRCVVLVLAYALLLTTMKGEISILIIFLIILLYGIFIGGYVLERRSVLEENQEKIGTKKLVIASMSAFIISIIPMLLLLLNLKVSWSYLLRSDLNDYNYFYFGISNNNWQVTQIIGYAFFAVLYTSVFTNLVVPKKYYFKRLASMCIVFLIGAFIFCVIQSVQVFKEEYSSFGSYLLYFLKQHLPTFLVVIPLLVFVNSNVLGVSNAFYYPYLTRKERKAQKAIEMELNKPNSRNQNNHYNNSFDDDDSFTSFKFN